MLNDRYSHAAVAAERAILERLKAGCSAPVAALADVAEGAESGKVDLYLRGSVFAADGSVTERLSTTAELNEDDLVNEAAAVGRAMAEELIANGAEQLLKSNS